MQHHIDRQACDVIHVAEVLDIAAQAVTKVADLQYLVEEECHLSHHGNRHQECMCPAEFSFEFVHHVEVSDEWHKEEHQVDL